MRRRAALAAPLLLLARPAGALDLPAARLTQGGFVVARVPVGSRAALDGRALRVSPAGDVAFGFGRDAAAQAVLVVTNPRGQAETTRLAIARRTWDVQSIQGLPPAQVTPNAADLARIAAEREQLGAARAADTGDTGFTAGMAWPAQGRISGVYGSQRILNGQPRQPHFGLDVAAPIGTPVLAAMPGRVSLAGEFIFFGRLLVLDHGHGINTLYAHLSAQDVALGDVVAKGQRIGAIGMTGRVTGPHLHFSLSWFQLFLDPRPPLPPA
ncbi:M23 family metallopeptidase [Humitalea sp. 24SJ18S-53]|uniref:M23 family metallopeptidase n=1 Tax=Humitalea sp. 24SJ18S-53 TaxID=3422307 RepID=UPI003D66FE03